MQFWQAALLGANPYRYWLTVSGSLTHALMRRCPEFKVRRLRQGAGRPFRDEAEALGLHPGRLALLRNVRLDCGSSAVVFAHSVIPFAGLDGPWRHLAGLGNRPLGAALFTDPRIHRQAMEYRRLDRRHPLYRSATAHLGRLPATLWARRSLFELEAQSILVTEVFLPAVLEL